MKSYLPAALLLCLLACRVAFALPVDKAKLRKEARLPVSMSVNFSLAFTTPSESATRTYANAPLRSLSLQAVRQRAERNPEDADTAFRLSELLMEAKKYTQSQDACQKAARLYRKQMLAHSTDTYAIEMLARSLNGAKRDAEAEALLRRTIDKRFNSPRLWLTLGQLLQNKVWRLTGPQKPGEHYAFQASDFASALAFFQKHQPPARQKQAVYKALAETTRCYDLAVALAPYSATMYRERAGYRMSKGMLSLYLSVPKADMQALAKQFFNVEATDDLWQAAYLDSKNYATVMAAIMMEILQGAIEYGSQVGEEDDALWKAMPERSKRRMEGARTLLERLSHTQNASSASEILTDIALLEFMKGDRGEAEKHLRRAIDLNPSAPKAWELLTGVLAKQERYTDLKALYQRRLRYDNSAANHLVLAKSMEKDGQEQQAAEQVRAARQLAPKNYQVLLASAVIALKQNDSAGLQEAGRLLEQARTAQEKDMGVDEKIQFTFTRAIYLGLTDKVEEARALLKPLTDNETYGESARAALAALD